MSAYGKDIWRLIRGTMGRFISIAIISMLSVGLFAGIRSAEPDMRLTAHNYFLEQNLMDVQILSTLGFSDRDIEALEREGITVMPSYTLDALGSVQGHEGEFNLKLYAYDHPSPLNQLVLREGRMAAGLGECVVDWRLAQDLGLSLGEEIRLASGKEEPITDNLHTEVLTLVGVAESPMFISFDYGRSGVGNGTAEGAVFLPGEAFAVEVYTAVYLGLEAGRSLDNGGQEYRDYVQEQVDWLEEVAKVRAPQRYAEVTEEGYEKLAEAEAELADGERERDEKIAEAWEKIRDAQAQIEDGERELAEGRETFDREMADARWELLKAKHELQDGERELWDAEEELYDGERQIQEAWLDIERGSEQISDGYSELAAGEAQLAAAKAQLDQLAQTIAGMSPGDPYLSAYQAQYDAGMAQYREGAAQLSQGREALERGSAALSEGREELGAREKELEEGKEEVRKGWSELIEGWSAYAEGLAELEKGEREGLEKLAEGEQEIRDAKVKLADGERELAQQEEESAATIADAREKIQDAREELDDLKEPEWYFFTRQDLPSHAEYFDDAQRVAAIGLVFPMVFFAVALLISLTTMSRMVDEQRGIIGTFKMLGYSQGAIAMKYVLYALLSSALGASLGMALGRWFFPIFIANAYSIMYEMPPLILSFQWQPSLIATGLTVGLIVFAAWYCVRQELKTPPAGLLRPRSPKPGKRILLERIPPVWRRVPFSWKVTLRNIFRYKARFMMTLLGVAGCTALLLIGFGLKDSVGAVAPFQFEQIRHEDLLIAVEEEELSGGREGLAQMIAPFAQEAPIWWSQDTLTLESGDTGRKYTANLVVPEDADAFSRVMTLRTYGSKEPLALGEEGVILTYKAANLLKVSIGERITWADGDNRRFSAPVTGIAENYIDHYVIMTSGFYQSLTGEAYVPNLAGVFLTEAAKQDNTALAELLTAQEGVLTQSFTTDVLVRVGDMFGQLDGVVYILIGMAAILALVVLFNLNTINIAERIRELATIKVLGFVRREIATYILRESALLTLLGTALGCGLGVLLHRFVMLTAEVDKVMFGRAIAPASFAYASVLTVLFASIVFAALLPRLGRIDMVESLKSNE